MNLILDFPQLLSNLQPRPQGFSLKKWESAVCRRELANMCVRFETLQLSLVRAA